MNFLDLGLPGFLIEACESLGYTEPTPIQAQAIPVIATGADIIACAETGTGKTAAFLLPIIQKLADRKLIGTSVLVLAPTRELAIQTETACRALAPKKIRCAALIGGASINRQAEALRRGAHIIVATPGRLIDFMERGAIDFSTLDTLVLDEADRMLDMGFLPAIKRIVSTLPTERQTLFFSATMSPEIDKIGRLILREPTVIEVSRPGKAADTIKQTAYPVAAHSKTVLLLDLLERERFDRVLVFTRTRREAERLSHILEAREHKVNRLHADRSQSQREAALRGFKNGTTRILVATDIAARGIDVDSISHVINYDVPESPEDYVHRIGRTGRAGHTGNAITLLTAGDTLSMRAIERMTGQPVERILLPDFGGALHASPVAAKKSFAGGKSGSSHRRSFRPRASR